ncbi:hypothetical protein LTS18_005844, partial [Coniosporium uncinatum]
PSNPRRQQAKATKTIPTPPTTRSPSTEESRPTMRSRRATRPSYVEPTTIDSDDDASDEELIIRDAGMEDAEGSDFDLSYEDEEEDEEEGKLPSCSESRASGADDDGDLSVSEDDQIQDLVGPDSDVEIEGFGEEDDGLLAVHESKAKGESMSKRASTQALESVGSSKSLDLSLPPMSRIEDMFLDLTKKAMNEGFGDVLEHLGGRHLRFATMCSGTESPLLALQEVQKSLRKLGAKPFKLNHVFSAEIEPYKQAYIERNFHPEIIFRDIRELSRAESKTEGATTAYGAKVQIPGQIDLLVAGTSCVDYSKLNSKTKEYNEKGESRDTFLAVLAYAEIWRPTILILENVVGAPWQSMQKAYSKIDYELCFTKVDTRNYYLPHTRQRGYMVCVDRKQFGKNVSGAVLEWANLMKTFQR